MQLNSPKQLPAIDRPREKVKARGVESLTDLELLQAIIGSGTKALNVTEIATKVLELLNKRGEIQINIDKLLAIPGLSLAKACSILAAIEFTRRYHILDQLILDDATKILPVVAEFALEKQEHLICLSLDGARRMLAKRVVTIGTLSSTLVHPREVFADVIVDRAAGIILVHNHPSNVPYPSDEDIAVTRMLGESGKLLGITVYDHLIITKDNGWYSFSEENRL